MRTSSLTLSVALLVGSPADALTLPISDGTDGPFHPTASQTLDLPADGVFNFTTIDIPSGITVRFRSNAANTPVFLRATGAVSIAGVIDVSAGGVSLADLTNPGLGYLRPATTSTGGPGGGTGGIGGVGDTTCTGASCRDATAGTGLAPGLPGPTPTHAGVKVYGNSGSGGAMATAGLAGQYFPLDAGTPPVPRTAPGVPAVGYPDVLTGGSGGGGGSGWYFFTVQLGGGAGGGGGGALQISTPDTITVAGSLLALGANGGWAFANSGGLGGPGGGGSGGNIELIGGAAVTLLPTALVDATGGYGGGVSTQRYPDDPRRYENGARGGTGYLYVEGSQVALGGTVSAVVVAVPEPESYALMAAGLGVVLMARMRRARTPKTAADTADSVRVAG